MSSGYLRTHSSTPLIIYMVNAHLISYHLCLIVGPSNVISYSYLPICDRGDFFLEITNNFEGCQKNTLNNTKANSMEFKFR